MTTLLAELTAGEISPVTAVVSYKLCITVLRATELRFKYGDLSEIMRKSLANQAGTTTIVVNG